MKKVKKKKKKKKKKRREEEAKEEEKMFRFEVPKRTIFRHPVKVDKAGQKIFWNFSTLKKVCKE